MIDFPALSLSVKIISRWRCTVAITVVVWLCSAPDRNYSLLKSSGGGFITLGVEGGFASLVLGHLVDGVLLAVLGCAESLLNLRDGHLEGGRENKMKNSIDIWVQRRRFQCGTVDTRRQRDEVLHRECQDFCVCVSESFFCIKTPLLRLLHTLVGP